MNDMKPRTITLVLWAAISVQGLSQTKPAGVTDSNTALHAMQPDYEVPYGPAKAEEITAVLNRLYTYLDASTSARVADRSAKAEITDMKKLTPETNFEQGVFRLISYEWGLPMVQCSLPEK